MSQDQDQIFFKNYSIVIGVLVIMIIAFLLIARFVGTNKEAYIEQRTEQTAGLTAPVGKIRIQGEEAQALSESEIVASNLASGGGGEVNIGKQVYSGLCVSCHGTGLPGIPQLGDAAAWTPRIAQGAAILYERSIAGFTGTSGIMMPAKGGNPKLSDEEVKAAVDYMIENSQ